MFFARLNSKKKIATGIAVFLVIMVILFFVGYKLNNYKNDGINEDQSDSQSDVKIKVLRTQNELADLYKQDMARILKRLNEIDNKEDLVVMAENGFFDFLVPEDMHELHRKKATEAGKLLEDNNLSTEEFKAKLIAIFSELDAENNKLIEFLRN